MRRWRKKKDPSYTTKGIDRSFQSRRLPCWSISRLPRLAGWQASPLWLLHSHEPPQAATAPAARRKKKKVKLCLKVGVFLLLKFLRRKIFGSDSLPPLDLVVSELFCLLNLSQRLRVISRCSVITLYNSRWVFLIAVKKRVFRW